MPPIGNHGIEEPRNCFRFLAFRICRKEILFWSHGSLAIGCIYAPIHAPVAVACSLGAEAVFECGPELAPRLRHFPDGYESFASVPWGMESLLCLHAMKL